MVVSLVIIFDLLELQTFVFTRISSLITGCGGQGIDHPDSIAVKRKFSLSDGKAHIFSEDVGRGAAPLVEFPEGAFEPAGLLQAHTKWADFDSGFVDDRTEFSVVLPPLS